LQPASWLGAKRVRIACLAAHLLLIVTVCLRDTFSIFATTPTVFPAVTKEFWQRGEETAAMLLGQRLDHSNWLRNGVELYLHGAGIEAGYGFFAPNVPANYKLVFELHYPDGRVEYEIPRVSNAATGLRFAGLLDQVAELNYAPLRETMMKIIAYAVWQEHPNGTMVRAYFGSARLPTPAEFEKGSKSSYELLFAYDFTFHGTTKNPSTP
jgi:hypothetical protein